jgi:hypothetical protein
MKTRLVVKAVVETNKKQPTLRVVVTENRCGRGGLFYLMHVQSSLGLLNTSARCLSRTKRTCNCMRPRSKFSTSTMLRTLVD